MSDTASELEEELKKKQPYLIGPGTEFKRIPVTDEDVDNAKNRQAILAMAADFVRENADEFFYVEDNDRRTAEGVMYTETAAEQRLEIVIQIASWLLGE